MRFSVIMPCHNAGRWIGETLRSVAAQTHPAHEIIVIDDASSDDSLAQIEQSRVPVKLLRVSERNAAAARNAGIAAACGDWIAMLDADDVWYPNHLARAAALLARNNDVAYAANHDWIDLDGRPIAIPDESRCKLLAPATGLTAGDYFSILREGFHFGHLTVIYRADRLREAGMFDVSQRRRHDFDLWLRMIAGGGWTYDTEKQAGYRFGVPGSISQGGIDCDYFYLRALNRNLHGASSEQMRRHLRRQSRRAMGIAFVDGTIEEYARIRGIAWPFLPAALKSFYLCGSLFPRAVRRMLRFKRQIAARFGLGPASPG